MPPFADRADARPSPRQAQPAPRRWPSAAARLLQWLALAGLWIGWPLSPWVIAVIQGRWRPLRRYGATLAQCARMLRAMANKDVVYRNARRKLSGASAMQEQVEGQCTHCGRCCIDHQCVFLTMHDSGDGQAPRSHCSIYGSRFFRFTSCGLYPVTGADIVAYDCPSFTAKPLGTLSQGRVIPIRPANDASTGRRDVA